MIPASIKTVPCTCPRKLEWGIRTVNGRWMTTHRYQNPDRKAYTFPNWNTVLTCSRWTSQDECQQYLNTHQEAIDKAAFQKNQDTRTHCMPIPDYVLAGEVQRDCKCNKWVYITETDSMGQDHTVRVTVETYYKDLMVHLKDVYDNLIKAGVNPDDIKHIIPPGMEIVNGRS